MDRIGKMYKTRYTVLSRKLVDGDLLETDGLIEGLTTKIAGKRTLQIGGVIRDTRGEIF